MSNHNSILICEDHPMISIMLSDMITELLGDQVDIQVAGSLSAVRELAINPSLILLDLNLPDSDGLDTISAFQTLFPAQPKMICSGTLDESVAKVADMAGFRMINKASPYPQLLAALEGVLIEAELLSGHSPQLEKSAQQGNEFHSNIYAPGSNKPLTIKQVEIMKLTAEGKSAKEVARDLGISPDTVRGHMKEIFIRLGAKNKGQAVDVFIRAERKARLLDT